MIMPIFIARLETNNIAFHYGLNAYIVNQDTVSRMEKEKQREAENAK